MRSLPAFTLGLLLATSAQAQTPTASDLHGAGPVDQSARPEVIPSPRAAPVIEVTPPADQQMPQSQEPARGFDPMPARPPNRSN